MPENPKQHTSPCAACPFSRKVAPGSLGGSSPETYVGQARGPFWLPCHSTHDYKNLAARLDPSNAQCAGAAIFRANVEVAEQLPDKLLHLPPDRELVFATFEEFYAHHHGISLEAATQALKDYPPVERMRDEFAKAQKRIAAGVATLVPARKEQQ